MRDHGCIHDIPKWIVAHRPKYGHFSWLDHEQIIPKQRYQCLGKPDLDDGDDCGLTCANTKHFHPFCSPFKVSVPRANILGCLSHIMVAQKLAVTMGGRQWANQKSHNSLKK